MATERMYSEYMEARHGLNNAVERFIEAANKIGKSSWEIGSDITDSVYDADEFICKQMTEG